MDLLIVKMFIFLQLIMLISQQSRADQRNLGLSSLSGAINPVSLMGAVKLANDASKLIPSDSKAISDTMKTIENYIPIVFPQSPSSGESTIDEIKLDDRRLKLYLTPEQVAHLIKMAGLNSQNIDWKLYRCPVTLDQFKTIIVDLKGSSSSGLSIMPMNTYIPKIMSNLDRFDSYYRTLEKFTERMDLEEFLEIVDQLHKVNEGMVILPVGIKTGALQKPPGSIVLLGLGKFSADRKQLDPPSIVPTILIGQVRQVAPLQYEPDPIVEEIVTSTTTPETVVMETPKSGPETSTVLEVNESSLPDPNVPLAVSPSMTSSSGGDTFNNPTTVIGSDKVFSSSQSSAQAQATFFPSGPQSSMNHHPQPPRPMQRPPPPPPQQQARPNFRPPPPSFDGRLQQQSNLRPAIPRPRMDTQG